MNKPVRIYISANRGLPNLARSLSTLMDRVERSGIPRSNLVIVDSLPSEFEYPALQRLWLDSHVEDFHGLYLHCKSSSKIDDAEIENGLAWLNYMADGVLDNHQICRIHLERGADLVGCMWYRHFKGNFFWFRSSYVKTLEDPQSISFGTRLNAEFWCSQALWRNTKVLKPRVKNLGYLPISSDADFSSLHRNGVKLDLQKFHICCDIKDLESANNGCVYDRFVLDRKDYENHGELISRSSNYNSDFFLRT